MLYLTCTTISSVDLAQYGVSLAKDWVSVECGTSTKYLLATKYDRTKYPNSQKRFHLIGRKSAKFKENQTSRSERVANIRLLYGNSKSNRTVTL